MLRGRSGLEEGLAARRKCLGRWHLEGFDRQRQLHGRESDSAGSQYRRGFDSELPAVILSKKITVNVSGEILQLKETINTIVNQLNAFSGEVTRVAREVGTDGRLGEQANVLGVAGTWKDSNPLVNYMAGNLTGQVRNIAEVAIAIANGDLSCKIADDVRGEILQLKETLNTMVDQLNAFAGEVTRVAREVGTEGKLAVRRRCSVSPAPGKT